MSAAESIRDCISVLQSSSSSSSSDNVHHHCVHYMHHIHDVRASVIGRERKCPHNLSVSSSPSFKRTSPTSFSSHQYNHHWKKRLDVSNLSNTYCMDMQVNVNILAPPSATPPHASSPHTSRSIKNAWKTREDVSSVA